ncbi:MAG: DUF1805 domain-containing protein [Alicyclobacillaceae bacterium]|nr:DUF1805 domain-containing protein [Alicyclobacillaceae bacterium]
MIEVQPIHVDGETFLGICVRLPKTNLLAICSDSGYAMCGALDVQLLRDKLADRGIIAMRAVGVRTLEELLNGTVDTCTQAAESLGIQPGMPVREALLRIRAREHQ